MPFYKFHNNKGLKKVFICHMSFTRTFLVSVSSAFNFLSLFFFVFYLFPVIGKMILCFLATSKYSVIFSFSFAWYSCPSMRPSKILTLNMFIFLSQVWNLDFLIQVNSWWLVIFVVTSLTETFEEIMHLAFFAIFYEWCACLHN